MRHFSFPSSLPAPGSAAADPRRRPSWRARTRGRAMRAPPRARGRDERPGLLALRRACAGRSARAATLGRCFVARAEISRVHRETFKVAKRGFSMKTAFERTFLYRAWCVLHSRMREGSTLRVGNLACILILMSRVCVRCVRMRARGVGRKFWGNFLCRSRIFFRYSFRLRYPRAKHSKRLPENQHFRFRVPSVLGHGRRRPTT